MPELIFLFVILPRRIGQAARERGQRAFPWILAASFVAWIGLELAAGFVFGEAFGVR
jgi:hypothetical protein